MSRTSPGQSAPMITPAGFGVNCARTLGGKLKMKAAVWNDRGSLDIVERPVPEPRPGWVRVKVSSVGICGSDLHFYRGSFPSPAGLLPGHEVGGVVDRAGEGAEVTAGTPVAVEPLASCGRCAQCLT